MPTTQARAIVIGAVGLLSACSRSEPAPAVDKVSPQQPAGAATLQARAKAVFAPLPEVMKSPQHELSAERVALGHQLYFDTRLSRG